MEFKTYWSVLETPAYTINSGVYFLILAIIGGVCFKLVQKHKQDKGDEERFTLLFGSGLTILFGLIMFILRTFIYPDQYASEMAKKFESNEFNVVEGPVSNFQRKEEKHRGVSVVTETFTIDTVRFAYGNALMARFGSFDKVNNDVIYNGRILRIAYSDNSPYHENYKFILKIDIRK